MVKANLRLAIYHQPASMSASEANVVLPHKKKHNSASAIPKRPYPLTGPTQVPKQLYKNTFDDAYRPEAKLNYYVPISEKAQSQHHVPVTENRPLRGLLNLVGFE